MDDENISDLNSKSPKESSAKILLLGDFDPEGERIIRDPYYVNERFSSFSFLQFTKIRNEIICRMMALLDSKSAMYSVFDVARLSWPKS